MEGLSRAAKPASEAREPYTMFGVEQLGLRAIAETLTADGLPSPAAYDRARNRHRNPIGWSHAAVRAILTNPTYRGVRVWGKQERFETLLDPDDVAAGNCTRMRWRNIDNWITPETRTHEPLVSEDLATLARGRIAVRTPGRSKPRISEYPYALRGIIVCGHCGTKLQGSYGPAKTEGAGRVLYRCEIRRGRALPAELADHPATVYVNEAAIIGPLDRWIESFSDPAWLAAGQTADPVVTARMVGLRAQLGDLDRRIANLVDAVETGNDRGPIMAQLAQRTAERDAIQVRLAAIAAPPVLTEQQIAVIVEELGGISKVLKSATAKERAAIYESLDIRLDYDHRTRQVRASSNLARVVGVSEGRGELDAHGGIPDGIDTGELIQGSTVRRADGPTR